MVLQAVVSRFGRRASVAALLLAGGMPLPVAAADPAPFDLPGPGLRIGVTRGGETLPIGAVPTFAPGDTLTIRADLPADQRAHYLLLSAFLNGATNPPPRKWINTAETWKAKDKDRLLSLTIPDGARQMALFLVPETGGAAATISDAVRGKPGEFVRATQDLSQASLDRSRLNAFMAAIRRQENTHPEYLKTIAPLLARSLSIKLNADCLAKVIELQAACLLENRDALVLSDIHTSSMTDTLIGAPTDLALQLSYTREAGLGYYSPYIGVIRDIARVFGAFNNPQFNYLPTLSMRDGDKVSLLLNAAPSFAKPKSVLVVSMPAIGGETPPHLRNAADGALCGARPDLVLPVDGAPLVFSTGYAREMVARLTDKAGATVDLPLDARADRGGYVVKDGMPAGRFAGTVKAKIQGYWGFDRFDGPSFDLQFPGPGAWEVRDAASLVTGRDNAVALSGPAPACVESVAMRRGDGAPQPVAWKLAANGDLAITVPLQSAHAGEIALDIRQYGVAETASVKLRAYDPASRLDGLTIHAGDAFGVLSGQRLDRVASVELGALRLSPDGLAREGNVDRLTLKGGDGGAAKAGAATARVTLDDGRTLSLPVSVESPRPRVGLVSRTMTPPPPAGLPLSLATGDVLASGGRLVFSVRAGEGTRLRKSDSIEVATADQSSSTTIAPGADLALQGPDILVATLDPARLGASAAGPLQFRLVRGDEASDWVPLATLARLPRIAGVDCKPGDDRCTLRGDDLFLLDSVAADTRPDAAMPVPAGYTSGSLAVPRPKNGRLYLRLRDSPAVVATVPVATG